MTRRANPRDAGRVGGSKSGSASGTPSTTGRVRELDTLRGLAIVAMIGYHFCFDLRYFGLLRANLEYDWRWITARTIILSSFLLIAGVSAVLADAARAAGAPGRRRWHTRVAVIALAALAVSAGSYLMFPRSYIWFGVLHAIAVSLVIAQLVVRRPALAVVAGIAVIVAGVTFESAAFDNRALGWLGFMTAKPLAEDYVPLFPWTGVLLVGIGAGHALLRSGFAALAPLARAPSGLRFLGRHSLIVYLVHQPILIGALWALVHHSG
jgi:uncharacterized membrane protein